MITCTYCGEPADTRDHVVPVSWNHNGRPTSVSYQNTVSCCKHCNNLLGAVPIHNVDSRRAFVAKKLSNKVKEFTKWTPEELEELGPELKSRIEQTMLDKQALERRLLYALSIG